MAKQTLFEAEGIISIRTADMNRQIDDAVRQAKARIQAAFAGFNPGILGGGKGGSGGGGSSASNPAAKARRDAIDLERQWARNDAAVGKYADAITRLTLLSKQFNLTQKEAAQIAGQLAAVERRQLAATGRILTKDGRTAASGALATERGGQAALKAQAMEAERLYRAQVQGAVIAGRYGDAMTMIRQRMTQLAPTTSMYAKEVARLERTMQLAANPRQIDPMLRRQNAVMQNASFALQDFVVVASMGGGMSRALAAASNNVAFMAAQLNTANGAFIGIAATIAAVFLPALIKAATGMKTFAETTEDITKRLERVRKAVELVGRFSSFNRGLGRENDINKLLEDRLGLMDEIATARDKVEEQFNQAAQGRQGIRNALADSIESMLPTYFRLGSAEMTKVLQDAVAKLRSGDMDAADLMGLRDTVGAGLSFADMLGITQSIQDAIDQLEATGVESADVAEEFENLTRELKLLQERIKKLQMMAGRLEQGMFDPFGTAPGRPGGAAGLGIPGFAGPTRPGGARFPGGMAMEHAARRAAAEGFRQQAMTRNQEMGSDLEVMMEELFPKENKIREINEKWDKRLEMLTESDTVTADDIKTAESLRRQEIAEAGRNSRKISGVAGPAEFANQLTNTLLQRDPMTKLAEEAQKHSGFWEKLIGISEEIKTNTKNLEAQGVFTNN